MNYKMIGRFIAQIILIEAAFMVPPAVISLCNQETGAFLGFLYTVCMLLAAFGILMLMCRKAPSKLTAHEGLVCVGISWIILSLFGALPFFFSGEAQFNRYIDCFFECVSGFTTTGSSILSDVEALPKGLLYWRSFSNWLGGMGVLVFLLALAPNAKGSGFTIHLLRAESPGPDVGKIVPKMRNSAAIPYVIYISLTVVNLLLLLIGGMSLFDAVCTAMSTAGTGGFGIRNSSFGDFTPYIQIVTTVFMALFGINFSVYYLLLLKQVKHLWKDEEIRLYLGIILVATGLIAWNIGSMYTSLGEAVRHAVFQVVSIITTTGFASTDFDLWPSFSKAIILLLMIVGACAGSTGGGLKCSRLILILRTLRRNIRQLLNPQQVQVIRLNGRVVDERVLSNTNGYLAAYVLILFVSFAVVSIDPINYSVATNFTAVLNCFNNIGPGLEQVGPTCNFYAYSDVSKLVLCFNMLAGRLEIFPILVLLSRSAWKK